MKVKIVQVNPDHEDASKHVGKLAEALDAGFVIIACVALEDNWLAYTLVKREISPQ